MAKVPFQFFILFIGAMVFVFYTFVEPPVVFEPSGMGDLRRDAAFSELETRYSEAFESRKQAAIRLVEGGSEAEFQAAQNSHYLKVVKLLTVLWGAFAVLTADLAGGYGSLIETINMLGSLFYGSMLGIFLLAFFFRRVGATAAFYSVLIGQAAVFWTAWATSISFLWYNVVGCGVVVAAALILSPRAAD